MRIGIPRESKPGETLVAATAKTTGQLVGLGYDVVVESGAGAFADQPDDAYADAGATVGTRRRRLGLRDRHQGQRAERRRGRRGCRTAPRWCR